MAPPGKGDTTSEAPHGGPQNHVEAANPGAEVGRKEEWLFHPQNVFRTRLVFPQSAQAFSRDLKCVIGLNVPRQDSAEPPPRAAKNRAALNCAPRRGGPARGLRHHLVWSPPLILETRSRSKDLPGWPGHLASPKKGPSVTDTRALRVFSPKGPCCFDGYALG